MEDAEYDLMHRVEDRMWWFRAVHARLLDAYGRLPDAERAPVLDAGCGTGGLMARLLAAAPPRPVVGLDFEPRACAYARGKTGAAVVAGSVDALPFGDGVFAAAFSVDVLCHRGVDEGRALAELRRVLRPGGILVLNLPAYEWMKSAHDERVHTARRYTRGGLARRLREAGFEGIDARYWNTFLFPLMAVRRKLLAPPGSGTSDVMEYPDVVDRLFRGVAEAERAVARAGLPMPFGGSVMAVATRPHEPPDRTQ
jgi:SAM-dependent methyltransferase